MATKDAAKREGNVAMAASRAARSAGKIGAADMALQVRHSWLARNYPDSEYQRALAWAGSLERLWQWFQTTDEINAVGRANLVIEPMDMGVADQIRASALDYRRDLDNGLEPTAPSALTLSRRFNLPIDVIYYYGDPYLIDTYSRPWLKGRFNAR